MRFFQAHIIQDSHVIHGLVDRAISLRIIQLFAAAVSARIDQDKLEVIP